MMKQKINIKEKNKLMKKKKKMMMKINKNFMKAMIMNKLKMLINNSSSNNDIKIILNYYQSILIIYHLLKWLMDLILYLILLYLN